jgi:lipopolysaccharide/colanic/teichoic acid biosynthesis glycosyltransferase
MSTTPPMEQPRSGALRQATKRACDLLGAVICLVLATPLMVAAAVAIKMTSRGPVFYSQARAGKHGQPFRMWKFRSMYADSERRRRDLEQANEADGHLFKIRDDPRVTPVGRLLRRWSVDELPQLINVLAGEMSLVGPRPLPVTESDYTGASRRRLLCLPGITGLWQVSGRSETTWEEAVQLDLYYVDNWSLSLDVTILARTVATVLSRRGAF